MSRHPSDGRDGDEGDGATPDTEEASAAAQKAVEPERLLAGEQEDSLDVVDALHWVKVYGELLDFKRNLLTMTQQQMSSMDAAAQAEVKRTDLEVIEAEADRFERRLDFWRGRSTMLQEGG